MTGPNERVWESGWDGHERAQLERVAKLPLVEKLRWLEQADRLARQLSHGLQAAGSGLPSVSGSGRRPGTNS